MFVLLLPQARGCHHLAAAAAAAPQPQSTPPLTAPPLPPSLPRPRPLRRSLEAPLPPRAAAVAGIAGIIQLLPDERRPRSRRTRLLPPHPCRLLQSLLWPSTIQDEMVSAMCEDRRLGCYEHSRWLKMAHITASSFGYGDGEGLERFRKQRMH
ncbi:putative bifunctional UDP-N-acetylglucosamine transferase and deubiquitinase ALG13 [Lolium rigidum]|uniref:putative bifunctional UDP-N-acetylglucosamine transferase and deubiquitinase ALG13 n=1 Tax=Lolium rigidum TaxID=89674 RepID=UPI001F5C6209|nr:putative bifunctional UDP-N-acetylglucosamine transferase and deubiquitinase ALG13 [Lolium rigidum]